MAYDELGADYLLACREEHGNVAPVLLAKGEEVGTLRADVPYQMANILLQVAPYAEGGRIAVVARRCDEKAIAEMSKRGLLNSEKIAVIGLACDDKQITECRCSDPCPANVRVGDCGKPYPEDEHVERILAMSPAERLDFWVGQFRKCNKCYGCTSNCPVCFCDECLLEEKTFTPEKGIPPGFAFHLIRSVHLADKCVECGECERACPADIPLLALRKMVNRDIKELYGYVAGDGERISPLLTTLEGGPLEDDEHAC